MRWFLKRLARDVCQLCPNTPRNLLSAPISETVASIVDFLHFAEDLSVEAGISRLSVAF